MKRLFSQRILLVAMILTASYTANALIHNYGCQGNITIYVGEEKTLSHPFPYNAYVPSTADGWYLYSHEGAIWFYSQEAKGAKIVSKTNSTCTIKGMWDNTNSPVSDLQLWCKGTRVSQNEEYECYWNIIVKGYEEQYKDGDELTAKTQEGINVKYHVVSAKDKTCQVGGNYTQAIEQTSAGEITIPSVVKGFSVIQIGASAFYRCEGLTAVHLPNSITVIGNSAFSNCSNLESVNIPNNLKTIDSWAFNMCEKLTSPIVIPEGVTVIEELTFNACNKIPSVTLPSTLTTIGKRAFDMCYALQSVNLPEGLTSIGNDAFRGAAISSVHIPSRVSNIGSQAFCQCSNLERITVANGNTFYDSRDNCNAIIETGTNTLLQGCKNTTIPLDITSIGDYSFYYCRDLVSIVLPDGLISIGNYAFENAHLKSINIPKSLKTIGECAFAGCEFRSILLPDGVQIIGKQAFYSNSLRTISIPESVVSIGEMAFAYNSHLYYYKGNIYSYAKQPVDINENVFYEDPSRIQHEYKVYNEATLYIPQGSKTKYESAEGWKNFKNIVEMIAPDAISLPTTTTIRVGENIKLTPTIMPDDAVTTLTWSSDDESIATVSNEGVVTGVTAGQTFINVTTDNGKTAYCKLTVKEPEVKVASIILDVSTMDLVEGNSQTLGATVKPDNATDKTVTWSSDDASVATVDNTGKVTAVAAGEATITCTANDESGVSATCKVTVKAAVKGIELPKTMTVAAGQTLTLTPTITPADAVTALTWTSDDETIATVNSDGVVTGVKKGQTFINVETDNGKSAYCKLTVTAPDPISITLPKSATLHAGETVTLTATITPEDAETTLTWKSDDESVVLVSADGVLTGVTEGLALVTATTSNGLTSNACKVKVEAPDGITDVQSGDKAGTVYTISGQRLVAPKKGLNIVGGRKVVVK